MKQENRLSGFEKFAYGIGAVGKDMVYMLSATYILYYYQDVCGVSAWAMGIILFAARIFDAFNDPIMGVLVAKTKTKWGKFRPWLFVGTGLNAIVLYLMFAAPPTLDGGGLVAYAAITYILWGVTYTMMDIPYWSMVPAFTQGGKEREGLSALARSCAGAGSALITIITVKCVSYLGNAFAQAGSDVERTGYRLFALAISVIFILFTTITCMAIKEKSSVDMETVSVGDMFKALVRNDQAMTMVIAIVVINSALYSTANLIIYFFKYDFSPANWENNYTLFNTFGGACQILAMMLLFPMLRKLTNTMRIFYISFFMAFGGYLSFLLIAFFMNDNMGLLLLPAFLIMSALGLMNVIVTIFLANSVDYGEWKNGRRDESVIFSMQTFVVKLASGIAALFATLVLTVFRISKDETVDAVVNAQSRMGLRFSMTIIPIAVLLVGLIIFKRHYVLTDEKLESISKEIQERRG